MGRSQGGQTAQGVPPLVQGLAGEAVDEVQVDVVKSCLADSPEGRNGLVGVVATAQQVKQVVIQGLHPDTDTVYALGQQAGGLSGNHQVPGVGLDGNFRVGAEGKVLADGLHNPVQKTVGKVGGRTTAEEDGVDGRVVQGPRPRGKLGQQGVQEGVHEGFYALIGVEIAVGALGLAEGDMNVEGDAGLPQRGQVVCRASFGVPARNKCGFSSRGQPASLSRHR